MHCAFRKSLTSWAQHRNACRNLEFANLFMSKSSFFTTSLAMLGKVIPFKLADIGEGITEVRILDVKVKPGTVLNEFDQICEVQSDKATVDITSPYAGNVINVHIKAGETALVGQPILDLELTDESTKSDTHEESASDKNTQADNNDLQKQKTQNHDVRTETASTENTTETESQILSNYKQNDAKETKPILATPATRFLAKQNKIALGDIHPTGKGGRITKEDVLNYLDTHREGVPTKMSSSSEHAPRASPSSSSSQAREAKASTSEFPVKVEENDTVIEIVGVRKGMVKTMTAAASIACFGFSEEYNMSELIKLKDELKNAVKNISDGQVKLTLMPFFIKAAALALIEYPELNAHCSASCDLLVKKSKINIGVAMDTPSGLIVPVIKDVAKLSIYEIALELQHLVNKGKANRLSLSDLSGGTFTLSNIGVIGGINTSPVLLPPQVAIAAIGRLQRLPRFATANTNAKNNDIAESNCSSNGKLAQSSRIEIQEIVTISFSGDHRVIDGATAVRFANCMKQYIEHPAQMTLRLRERATERLFK